MKWILSFVVKGVLGFVAIRFADKWYVKVAGVAFTVWALGDLLWLWNSATGRSDGAAEVAAGVAGASFSMLSSGLRALAELIG